MGHSVIMVNKLCLYIHVMRLRVDVDDHKNWVRKGWFDVILCLKEESYMSTASTKNDSMVIFCN